MSDAAYDDDLRKHSVTRCALTPEVKDRMQATESPANSDLRSLTLFEVGCLLRALGKPPYTPC